jgi:uncharacterized protein with PIN domain
VIDRCGVLAASSSFALIVPNLVRNKLTVQKIKFPVKFPVSRELWAYRKRTSNESAKLNFADCFAYALAKESGEPLLFKGGDFAHTDITAALPAEL